MRKLALPDNILMAVDKPARYIGNEVNVIEKDLDDIDIRFCICFPDVYEIGMSHMGIQIIYDMLNKRKDVWCERVFSPWVDLDKILRKEEIPLFALESQSPIRDFDFLGITIQYEMCYTNILQVLELSNIPRYHYQRGDDIPIVIGGGPCAYNPEPLADFFDIFYIGESEVTLDDLLDAYKVCKSKGLSRVEFLERAAQIEGIYVPAFYDVSYTEDGKIASFKPNNPSGKKIINRQVVRDMGDMRKAPYPLKPIVPFIQIIQDRVVLEIQRGCIRGCRFCQAGTVTRPNRGRKLEDLKFIAREMLKNTGHQEISLSSLSSSDYPELHNLVSYLVDEFKEQGVNISLPSLRIDEVSVEIMNKVQDIKKSSITFAPEAATQKLRNVINKGLTFDMIYDGAGLAFESGWNKVKLYFMLGLPKENDEDRRLIASLSNLLADRYYEIPKDKRNGKCQITISTSFFIPKPFTVFQTLYMHSKEEYIEMAKTVKKMVSNQTNRKSLRYIWHEADVTLIEGLLARGSRRVGKVIEKAYELGCLYDSWADHFNNDLWLKAIEEAEIDLDFYTTRGIDWGEIMPWHFIDIGVSEKFLKDELLNSINERVTPTCRTECTKCGVSKHKSGICVGR